DMAAGRMQFAQQPERSGLCLAVTKSVPRDPRVQPNLDLLLIAGALCNDAVLQRDEDEPGVYRAIGDPPEGALGGGAGWRGCPRGPVPPRKCPPAWRGSGGDARLEASRLPTSR